MTKVFDLEKDYKRIVIREGRYEVSVLTQGAILNSFKIDDVDVCLGYKDYRSYIDCPSHMGEVVGPFANRIKDARFKLDAVEYTLEKNNNGRNSLHSGSKSFGLENFSIAGISDSSVTLALISGEKGGFPGTHEVLVTYMLSGGALTISYQVASDKKCPVNITNHAYFNLNGKGDIRSQEIMIPSDEYIAVDEYLIPTEIRKSEGTDFDFNKSTVIGERRDGKYDHAFILREGEQVIAKGEKYQLRMLTDLPAVQFYTGAYLKNEGESLNGEIYGPHSGFALESEFYPDFVNRPDFRGSYTREGVPFKTSTTYILEDWL